MTVSTERFADYFGLQLRLAVLMADAKGLPLREAVNLYTNLRRRLGVFEPDDPAWQDLLDELDAAPTEADRLARTMARFHQAPDGWPPGRVAFGCFACEPPNAEGGLRIHFTNREVGTEPGPLSAVRKDHRLAELREMFAHVRREFSATRRVLGGSWALQSGGLSAPLSVSVWRLPACPGWTGKPWRDIHLGSDGRLSRPGEAGGACAVSGGSGDARHRAALAGVPVARDGGHRTGRGLLRFLRRLRCFGPFDLGAPLWRLAVGGYA